MTEKIDIRHMRVLLHLVREKNVSRVAERLEISQQAVSNYLKRMREVFPNELFLRQSAGLQPTDYAYDLAAKFEKIVEEVDSIFNSFPFDPATSEYVFRVIANEYAQLSIIPSLSLLMRKRAPGVKLEVIDFNPDQHAKTLAQGEADLVIGFSDYVDPGIRNTLRRDCYCCVARQGSPLHQQIRTLGDVSSHPHVDFASGVGNLGSRVDDFLSAREVSRTVIATLPCYTSLQAFMHVNDTVAFVPSAIAAAGRFQVIDIDMSSLDFNVVVGWHRRASGNASRDWLTQVMKELPASH
ncbi:LysR family transcriptional regulator [Pseudomonas fluorescens]|uniref:LysR family transcriptional regulator n=1 Tax=Pseudomonas fluorescens TaxID=294 RepID=A0A944HD01_PSEFL|nr:LysR family transcriptional regulator [Pseudomonas fluorescens]MBT2298476.1 LysR family transcriptional regulator [Pseudomonas fluorescens]MBT2310002.1 LysR family transcriptional regulator [Pseudomonas fluorescens]MBT2311025.1 LysR family transcriptional regulator [Pseudomonas fluorescens]MBT2320040.1 LysR family transcriptional regulator [Pseudomonas fluorescens]MBT2328932.1 LysR family transcriptional regulator [Pseudomonas fluorescens]